MLCIYCGCPDHGLGAQRTHNQRRGNENCRTEQAFRKPPRFILANRTPHHSLARTRPACCCRRARRRSWWAGVVVQVEEGAAADINLWCHCFLLSSVVNLVPDYYGQLSWLKWAGRSSAAYSNIQYTCILCLLAYYIWSRVHIFPRLLARAITWFWSRNGYTTLLSFKFELLKFIINAFSWSQGCIDKV